jgi:hypothetical protein
MSFMKKLIGKVRRISIIDPGALIDISQKTDESITQEYFKNCMYIIENRVVGLMKIGIKEQKNLVGASVRTLDLPNNFSLRVI